MLRGLLFCIILLLLHSWIASTGNHTAPQQGISTETVLSKTKGIRNKPTNDNSVQVSNSEAPGLSGVARGDYEYEERCRKTREKWRKYAIEILPTIKY